MSDQVVSLAAHRLKQAAIRKGERVRELVEELRQVRGVGDATDEDARYVMAAYWQNRGWCNHDEARLALKEFE